MPKEKGKVDSEEENIKEDTEEESPEPIEGESRRKRKKRERKEKQKEETKEKRKKSDKKRLFTRDLKVMMYGFGDVKNPLPESVDLVEDMVLKYVNDITMKAYQCSGKRGRLTTEDFIQAVSHDPKKSHRAKELLRLNEVIKKSKSIMPSEEGMIAEEVREEGPEKGKL